MPAKTDDLTRLLNSGVVAIIRTDRPEVIGDVADALVAGGVEALEVTFTVPKAHKILEQVADRLGDRVLLGAGTVLDPETARTAILAGARFIVSPVVRREVIELCRRYDRMVMPGAFTPTEILTAWEAGADIVKVFPSEFNGPRYLKTIHGPLPQVRLMPTGGVTPATAIDYLKAGACALGIGTALVDPQAIASGQMNKIEDLARQYVSIIRDYRQAEGR